VKILWATTFSADMWETSARHLIESYVSTKTPHKLVAYTEGMDLPDTPNAEGFRLEDDPVLSRFLLKNADVIPKKLGGNAPEPECRCRKGPHRVHDEKKHKLPCVGYWFCKNAFRWLRKVVAANLAAEAHPDYDVLMWVDADAGFLQHVPPEVVASWFAGKYGCIYLKSRRTAIETGVVGYHLRYGGAAVLQQTLARYVSGRFRRDRRWDDCVQLENGIVAARGVVTKDLATDVGERNTVIQHSPLGAYLGHDKGLHRRTGVLK
jgi:hypothetical protein